MIDRACRISHSEGWAKPGQRDHHHRRRPFGTPGSTNMLRIAFVGTDGQGGI
jgi:pyruvate kinase